MGNLLDELRLHARRLLCPFVGNDQLAVGGVKLLVCLSTQDGVNEEEGDDDDHDDNHGEQPLLRQFGTLLCNLAFLALSIVESGHQVSVDGSLPDEGRIVILGYDVGHSECRVTVSCQHVGTVFGHHVPSQVLHISLVAASHEEAVQLFVAAGSLLIAVRRQQIVAAIDDVGLLLGRLC